MSEIVSPRVSNAARCRYAELAWLQDMLQRPVTVDDWHRYCHRGHRVAAERQWERLKDWLRTHEIPREEVWVEREGGHGHGNDRLAIRLRLPRWKLDEWLNGGA